MAREGEMIPQPIVSRSVSCAINAETTVEERASIPCLRHQGYASASQTVSIPASSITRADSSISSSGSIVSCMTPIRNGGDISARPYNVAERRDAAPRHAASRSRGASFREESRVLSSESRARAPRRA